jgi:NAD(P)-dependent dehydrogenase (short-subunit alcohol dehydrogenase family)
MADGRLAGRIAVVAGATRGAGRGIACMLGEAGATVYCVGRSTRETRSPTGRPETVDETAEMVTTRGGIGIPVGLDLRDIDRVRELFERIENEQGRVDLLVNNLSGDQYLAKGMLSGSEHIDFWNYPIEKGLAIQVNAVHTHLVAAHHAARMMAEQRSGLIIEVTDGNRLSYNGVGVYYSLSKTSAVLLAYLMSEELRPHNVAVVSLTPGWLRSEKMLDGFGVTEENWRDALAECPSFEKSETPFYIGRAVVELAADPRIIEKSGHALSAGFLAREYGFSDVDGTQPPGYAWDGAAIVEGAFENGGFGAYVPE